MSSPATPPAPAQPATRPTPQAHAAHATPARYTTPCPAPTSDLTKPEDPR